MKLNGTHQQLVYINTVHVWGKNMRKKRKKSTDFLLHASKAADVEANTYNSGQQIQN
jgi:hypothetical protein